MRLFHYHHWTPYVRETEAFYQKLGFEVTLRLGNQKGEIKTFNPPLTWEDFGDQKVTFRIIEVRQGQVNITFGHGKKTIFDHIGFLVEPAEHDEICRRAETLGWKTEVGERRTFVDTPLPFRIELQPRKDVVTPDPDPLLKQMQIYINRGDMKVLADTGYLLGASQEGHQLVHEEWMLDFQEGQDALLNKVAFTSGRVFEDRDPTGVYVLNSVH
ncbi:MAG: hypothetical protein H0Z33_10695 [Bacillaceae bacterium]|nr:hypothetical protein [Bacillaceae bacterium]